MYFTKYHGCGNNFIVTRESEIGDDAICTDLTSDSEYSELAKSVCNSDTGIGADGLIIAREHPLEMIIYNRDGSRAPMCGNGIRCFANFCYDEGICDEGEHTVKTLAGEMLITLTCLSPFTVSVDMGKPDFDPAKIAVNSEEPFLEREVCGVTLNSFFMGTIHTVVWTDDFEGFEKLGERVSNHEIFREKTNVNFARIINANTVEVRTYERGAGVTSACGTGACSVAVLGKMQNKLQGDVNIILPYGKLLIKEMPAGNVIMEGPSEKICGGQYEYRRK